MSNPFTEIVCAAAPPCEFCAEWNALFAQLGASGAPVKSTKSMTDAEHLELCRRHRVYYKMIDLCWRAHSPAQDDAVGRLPCAQRSPVVRLDTLQERICAFIEGGVPVDSGFVSAAGPDLFCSTPRLRAAAERALGVQGGLDLLLWMGIRGDPKRLPLDTALPLGLVRASIVRRALVAAATHVYTDESVSCADCARRLQPPTMPRILRLYDAGVSDADSLSFAACLIERCDAVCDAEVLEGLAMQLDAFPWLALEHPACAERLAAVRGGRLQHLPLLRAQARFDAAFRKSDAAIACAVLLAPIRASTAIPETSDLYETIVHSNETLHSICTRIGASFEHEQRLGHRIGMHYFSFAPRLQFLKMMALYAEATEAFPKDLGGVIEAWWDDVATLVCRAPPALGVPPDVLRRACRSSAQRASADILRRAMGAERARAYVDWRAHEARIDRPRTPLTPAGRVRHALELDGADPVEIAMIDGALARWGGRSADLVAAYRAGLDWLSPVPLS